MSKFNFLTQNDHCGPLSSIPLEVDIETEFYRYLMYEYDSAKKLINGQNYFIDNILPNIFLGDYYINNGTAQPDKKTVTRVIIDFPRIEKNKVPENITPRMARALGVAYFSPIYVEVLTPTTFGVSTKIERIGSIPTMVGSNRCYTSQKPEEFENLDEWKFYSGECPSSQGGYFIGKSGSEKAIIHQEKLRTSNYFTVMSKEKPPRLVTIITCINKSETTIVRFQMGKRRPTIRVMLPHAKGRHYPFYLVFYILFLNGNQNNPRKTFDLNAIDDLICSFVPASEAIAIRVALTPNRSKFLKAFVTDENGYPSINDVRIRDYVTCKIRYENLSFKIISDKIFDDTFKQVPSVEKKVINLCVMAAQHLRCFLGYRPLDSRDSWANKKIDAPARTIELLVNSIFAGPNGLKNSEGFKLAAKSPDLMEETFKKSFNSYQWGFGKGQGKENVAEALKNDSFLAQNSQLTKINTPVDRRIKSFSVRGISSTSFGAICPAETPEGETCGIVKHLSCTTILSYNRFYETGRNQLLFSMLSDTDYSSFFTQGFNSKYLLTINNSGIEKLIGIQSGPLYISFQFLKSLFIKLKNLKLEEIVKIFQKDNGYVIEILLSSTNFPRKTVSIPHWTGNLITLDLPDLLIQSFNEVFGIYNQFFATVKQNDYNYAFTINGDVLVQENFQFYPTPLWVVSDLLVSYLKGKRRTKELPRDCCIYKNENDFIVQYYDDSGRELVPYLIVDKDGILMADKIKVNSLGQFDLDGIPLWSFIKKEDYSNAGKYIEMFYDLGVMELIDVKEYDSIFLAETIEQVRIFAIFRQFLDSLDDTMEIEGKILSKEMEIDNRELDNYMAPIKIDYRSLKNIQRLSREDAIEYLRQKFTFFEDMEVFYKMYVYVHKRFLFTHSFINPNSLFSGVSNMAPRANQEAGPRFTYQASMVKQALSMGSFVDYTRFETSNKRQIAPRRNSFETIGEQPLLINSLPITESPMLMIGVHRDNYEDATIMSKSFAIRMMRYEKNMTYKTTETSSKNYKDKITRPDDWNDSRNEGRNKNRFRHLGEDGLARIGSLIEEGDCVIGKIRIMYGSSEKKNMCIYAGVGDVGEVSAIQITCGEDNSENYRIICVKTVDRRYQINGDKLASRYAQKGTIGGQIGGNNGDQDFKGSFLGRIIDDNEMPFVRGGPNDGMKIDLIFNPAGFPSRMTCGKIFEILSSKAALYTQERVNASTFHEFEMQHFMDLLIDNGMDKWGNEFISHSDGEIVIDSTTGKEYKAFIGPCAYQVLRHQVLDKIQARSTGRYDPLTRQPIGGRYNHGGLRLGEMERDALIAHGGSQLMKERLMISSDLYKTTYCRFCHNLSADTPTSISECYFCKQTGFQGVVTHPRVLLIFTNIMNAMGINVNFFFKEDLSKKEIEDYKKIKEAEIIE